MPLHWDFPGGHLKDDETWEEGAIREVKEETDLDISNLTEVFVENQAKRIKFFKTTINEANITLDTAENEEYMWLKKEDLPNYDKLTPNVSKLVNKEM